MIVYLVSLLFLPFFLCVKVQKYSLSFARAKPLKFAPKTMYTIIHDQTVGIWAVRSTYIMCFIKLSPYNMKKIVPFDIKAMDK